MPREQITFSPMTPTDNPHVVIEQARRNAHVHWTNADRGVTGWVQLGIDVTVGELRTMLEDAVREAENAQRVAPHIGDIDVENFPFRVFSDVLDRAELNRLVRVCRTARDRAYGRDE